MARRRANTAPALRWIFLSILLHVPASLAVEPGNAESAPVALTEQERHWLAAHPVIRLAPDPDFPPVESLDPGGRYRGMAADYVALLERSLGIRFSIVRLPHWDQVLEAARNREVDLLGAATPTEKRAEYLSFTHPYLELPGHIITRRETQGSVSLEQLKGKKVAVVAGYAWQELLQRDYPDIELQPVADVPTGLSKVSSGGADAMIVNRAVASHYIRQRGLTDLRVAGKTEYTGRYAFAIRKDWPELNRILDKALLRIGIDKRAAILSKWTAPDPADPSTLIAAATYSSFERSNPDDLQTRIDAIERDSQLDPASRDQALELLRRALSRQEAARRSELEAAAFRRSLESAPRETKRIRRELGAGIAAGAPPASAIPAAATGAQLEQRLAQAQGDVDGAQKAKANLADEIKAQRGRPAQIQEQIAETKLAVDRLQWQLTAAPDSAEGAMIDEARRLAMGAEKHAHTAEIDRLEQELLSYDARLGLLIAQYNRSQLELSERESTERQLKTLVNALLADEAAAARQATQRDLRQVAGKHPLLQAAAEQNGELSQRLTEVVGQTAALGVERKAVRDQLADLDSDLRSIEQQLEIAGHSPALAEVLVAERRKLPNLKAYERRARERGQRIANARLKKFQLTEQRQRWLGNAMEPEAPAAANGFSGLPDQRADELRAQLSLLMTDRDALLGKLSDAYTNFAKESTALSRDERKLAELVAELTKLLDQRLLWTASTTPMGAAWVEQSRKSADWLLGPDRWVRAAADLVEASRQTPMRTAGTLLLFAALLGMRRQLRRRALAIARRVGNPYRDSFRLTVTQISIVLLSVLPWPLILLSAGWLLRSFLDAQHFSAAIGHGLTRVAITVFVVELYRRLSQPGGLAEAHFDWSAQACRVLHGNLTWIRWFVYPNSLVFGMIELQPPELVSDAPGRIAFMAGTLAVTVFLWRVMHPRRGALGTYLGARKKGWLWRLHNLWYPLLIAFPLALEALALSGYYYTATDLASRLGYSFYSILGLLVVYHLMLRWARIAEQRLALSRALEKRTAAREARAAQRAGEASGEGVPEQIELPRSSMQEISEQTRALLRALVVVLLTIALWLNWADLAPAGQLLDQIILWHHAAGAEGAERLEPVTLWALTKTAMVVVLTLIAVQNLPGFLEISLLRRLSLGRGSQYAITAVSRYVIIALGVIVASDLIGFGWSKVQWLVAALTVGLGFGLQEIFANFVSGLIVLFERPIRIGDTVTVGTTTGTVTRIRTRATTITDWDRKELIIPNKSFVTGDVINWTLSDPVTRLIIHVGVAYGSDVELTERLMRELAESHPLVLDEPPPAVFFRGFGDSALDFELRVFYKDVLKRTPLTHDLNKAINRRFAEHGIAIAFPQRDIHIRSIEARPGWPPDKGN